MASYIWEISVCLLETLVIIYLLYKKIGPKPGKVWRVAVAAVVLTGGISMLTLLRLPTLVRMAAFLVMCMLLSLWAFDGGRGGSWQRALLWPSCYLVIVTVADNITFTIADLMTDYPLDKLMSFGGARVPFTLIYLLIIAALVWALNHFSDPDPQLPLPVTVILFFLLGIGIFAAESVLDIALVLGITPATATHGSLLTKLSYLILAMVFSLMVIFEYMGLVLRRNKELKEQHRLAQIEQQQYELLTSATESLAEWKHDYQGQLRLISALISQERYTELKRYADSLDGALPVSTGLMLSGNRVMDAVISLRMMEAKRSFIRFETKLVLPDRIPLSDVIFASLVGNLLDNAVEACKKLPEEDREIQFEIRPWKQMLYIYCANSSDGAYQLGTRGVLLTTKQSSGHGIGVRRMREIVEQTGGTCQFEPEDKRFTVSIMIPLEENQA